MASLREKFANVRLSLRGKRHAKAASGAEGAYARAADDDCDCHCSICDEAEKEWDELLDEMDCLRAALEDKNGTMKKLVEKVEGLERSVEELRESNKKL